MQQIENKVCDGFLGTLKKRIGQRVKGRNYKWTLHKHLSRPRLVSYKAAMFPGAAGQAKTETSGLVQAVVRIHSLQSLRHVRTERTRDEKNKIQTREIVTDMQGREIVDEPGDAAPSDAKETVEYVVVQKTLRQGREGAWMVWGETEETTVENLKKEAKASKKGSRQPIISGA
jgi:mitochondrial protein MBA1